MCSPVRLLKYVIPQVEGRTILDVGCGDGMFGYALKTNFWETVSAQNQPTYIDGKRNSLRCNADYIAGYDVYRDTIFDKFEIYDNFTVGDGWILPYPDKSFDTVICTEVIEHMPNNQADALIKEMERVASKRIIITSCYKLFTFPEDEKYSNRYGEHHIQSYSYKKLIRKGYVFFNPEGKHILRFIKRFIERIWLRLTYNQWVLIKKI